MSYEFTKLSDVPTVSEFPEGANAIIETNGEIKRCPSSGGSSVPKPLTYDYMPEGYPSKAMGTVTVMEEQEVAFVSVGGAGIYAALLTEALDIVEGQTYTVNWDGTEYECVCYTFSSMLVLGNLSIKGTGDDTGEPFIYGDKSFGTLNTSASHTISVKTIGETVTPMADEFIPATALITGSIFDNTFSSELTNNELYAILLDGKQIVFYHTDAHEHLYLTKWRENESGRIDLAFAGENEYSISLYPNGTIGSVPIA